MLKMSFTSKIASLAVISSLALASISATSVLAAGTTATKEFRSERQVTHSLETTWKTDVANLQKDITRVSHIEASEKVWLKTHTSKDQKKLATDLVDQYLTEMQHAEAVIAQHHGFTNTGLVATNSTNLASKSVKILNSDLSQLRKTNERIDGLFK